jgi:serine/threonine-protein kinase
MSLTADPRIGTDLAGYRLESVLGRGGMGVVYLATDLRLERKVALKLVAPQLAGDPRFRERFLRESRLAASLDHSHVVPVHAAGETDGQLWIAMRYVQGTDLRTLLDEQGRLEPARALELCSQVGEALDAAHAHGLVHRDVKPANVLVTEEGGEEHCYLADFGLARSPGEARAAAPTQLSGTVDYTAPEQIAAEPANHRSDVYSLGCVLYECLAGERPFGRKSPMATLYAHATEAPPSLHERRPELPEAIDPVIATALAKEPDERYATCSEFCSAARAALGLGKPRAAGSDCERPGRSPREGPRAPGREALERAARSRSGPRRGRSRLPG